MQTTDIRYAPTVPSQVHAAKLLLDYFPDARLVPDPLASGSIILVLGANFAGEITVPTTTTTTLVPGTEVPRDDAPADHDRPRRRRPRPRARPRLRLLRSPATPARIAPTLAQCRPKVAVIGAGYVGLTSAACFAHLGHEVVCADVDEARVRTAREG